MDFKLNKKDAEVVLDHLYIAWDLAREDLQDKEANKIARIRDDMVKQYQSQIKTK